MRIWKEFKEFDTWQKIILITMIISGILYLVGTIGKLFM